MKDAGAVEAELYDWLETQGYPLEMEVAKAFRASGFRVEQGAYYEDPDTKKSREIDIVASQTRLYEELHVWLTCFVECKLSHEKPWVLFTSQRPENVSDRFNMVTSTLGMKLLFSTNRNKSPRPRILQPRDRLGYGITQGPRNPKSKEDNADVAYAAVMAATKAAVWRAARNKADFDVKDGEPIAEIIIPTVLIDGMLFEYFLDNDDTKRLRRIHSGVLTLGSPIPSRYHPTSVQILTKEGLPEFVSSMSELMEHMYEGSKQYYEPIMNRWEGIVNRVAKPSQ